ncbi:MAG: putative phytochrome sensor protein, partial [Frankiales bacterium]|nr:putative phytochrome sensor protein [Frankiales bacterium]
MRTQVHQERVLGGQRGVPEPAAVSALVQDSWLRSSGYGVDPDSAPPVDLVDEALEDHRSAHPMAAVLPVVRRLLVEHAASEDLVVAVTDAAGRLLWVEGHNGLRARCERLHFVAGARWDERSAGTNAPGVALALDRPVRIQAAEHWARQVQPWSCSAAPVHHPRSGVLLGALDVTGDSRAGTAGTLALVAATVAAVERELLLADLGARVPQRQGELQVLGAPAYCGAPLSTRHAEILLLLAEHPAGLTADQLACALDERDLDPVTVRAEVHRLRRELPAGMLLGRPYRCAAPVATDLDRVRRLLAQGRLDLAVDAYCSPVLPRSCAPGVVAIRNELAQQVRVALL